MNLQAAKTNFEREVAAKEESAEEARRNITKQLRELETQLEDERKARTMAQSSAKKIASELAEMESVIESETKGREDALRMYKKAQVSGSRGYVGVVRGHVGVIVQAQLKEAQLSARDATQHNGEMTGKIKELEKKIRTLDGDVTQAQEVWSFLIM